MLCLESRNRVPIWALGVWFVFISMTAPAGEEAPWPTLHRDYQRSGYTDEVVRGPYERKWYRDFHEEMIATRVEAIVAEGKCFVGTFAGSLYALDVRDGSTVWQFKAEGPIGHSPCYEAPRYYLPPSSADKKYPLSYDPGKLFFGADEGFQRGNLYCLRASDGKLLWKYEAGAGIWVSPACDRKKVYFGDRAGVFHAVSVQNGEVAWTFQTDNMILTPASFSPRMDKILFASEDMHVYCLTPSGDLLWKSPKLQGLSLRDHAPTIWQGLAIVRTNPADGFHTVLNRNGDLLKKVQQTIPLGPEDKVLFDQWGDVMMKESLERRQAEQDAIVKYLSENPYDRTFYALQLGDGKEPWIPPVFYTCGLHNPPTPPTFHPQTGEMYVYYRSALTNYLRGVRRYNALGRLNRQTGRIDFSWPEVRHPQSDWYGFPMIGDETQSLSLMDGILVGTHQGELSGLNLTTEKTTHIWRGRDTYGGIFGPAAVKGSFEGARELAARGFLTGMPNEWHGPDRSIIAIGEGRMFWVVGSQVVCIAGPDVPRTETGGTTPPSTPRSRLPLVGGGNVTHGPGGLDATVEKIALAVLDIEPILREAPAAHVKHATSSLADKLRSLLDAEVTELIEGGPWAPFIVELGIVNEQRYFWRTAETIQILSLAMPHLSPSVRAKAKRYLDEMYAGGMPLTVAVHDNEGRRREHYDFGSGMKRFAEGRVSYATNIEDLYAVWAYAHFTDAWDKVLRDKERIKKVFADSASQPLRFNHEDNQHDAAERVNAQIAGTLAFVRLMRKAGEDADAERAAGRLAELVTERVHHERADSRLIRRSGPAHNSKVPRYVELVPEVSLLLCQNAEEKLRYHVQGLVTQLPVWYQAFGERMIGGENYTHPPHLARGLFAALADGLHLAPEELARYLDQPWCKADLYTIEKLTAILRRMDSIQEMQAGTPALPDE